MTTTPEAPHPFQSLTPDLVQDALGSVGLWGDGRLMALSSYENRVYQAYLEEPCLGHNAVVLKFYRPERWSLAQIEEEHAFSAELVRAEVPVVAPLTLNGSTLHPFGGYVFSVCPRKGGRRPELDDLDVLEWVGRFLARIHTVGAQQPFAHRPALTTQSFALDSRDWLLAHHMVPLDMLSRWQTALAQALEVLQQVAPELAGYAATASTFPNPETAGEPIDGDGPPAGLRAIRLHGDCHPGNILWTPSDLPGGGPHFVDLDDARTGPAVQDLWMLLEGDRRQQTTALSALLDGYEQFRPFDRRELKLIEPLRTLRQIHYSAWLARRWADPTFPMNFPWFGSSDYWAGQVHQLQEQTEAMQEPSLVV
jgi:Ser/Thr protein kinase RdoA (MazF antagonist)